MRKIAQGKKNDPKTQNLILAAFACRAFRLCFRLSELRCAVFKISNRDHVPQPCSNRAFSALTATARKLYRALQSLSKTASQGQASAFPHLGLTRIVMDSRIKIIPESESSAWLELMRLEEAVEAR